MLKGSARVFIRNLHVPASACKLIDFIEVEGTKVLDLYVMWNKITRKFTRLLKATLLVKDIMNKWIEEGKANLGGVK